MVRKIRAFGPFLLALLAPAVSAGELSVRLREGVVPANPEVHGRVLVILTTDSSSEPRFQVSSDYRSPQVFGFDVQAWQPGTARSLNETAEGHPIRRFGDLPAGRYWTQAVLHRYETVTPAHGKTIRVPWDRGEGQQWNLAPGNLLSKPQWVEWNGRASVQLELQTEVPPIPKPTDSEWIRRVSVRSERLSKFWNRDVTLTAHVLVPRGFDENRDTRFPLMIFHGHFPADIGGFRPDPPEADLECQPSARFHLPCYNRTQQEEGHRFFQRWTGPDFPRFVAVEIQHPTPFYDDSYAVNSENNGPYGDAITYELIPEIERQYRGVGAWGRFLYGGSTGGWEALAAQIFYPDQYNGAFGACPDPVDFRSLLLVDLYGEPNAYRRKGPFSQIEIPAHRDYLGQVTVMMEHENGMERALGSMGRSGGQWDGWQSVYSPLGADGYPAAIFDKGTGVIDKSVAAHWRDNYDLRHILERDWKSLQPSLRGKLFVFVGDMDNYYLNDAVYLLEEFFKKADPPADAEVAYGDRDEHCWNGDPNLPNAISRLRYHEMYLERIAKRLIQTSPPGSGADRWLSGGYLRIP